MDDEIAGFWRSRILVQMGDIVFLLTWNWHLIEDAECLYLYIPIFFHVILPNIPLVKLRINPVANSFGELHSLMQFCYVLV